MRLAIIGCNGRMGKELLKLAASNNYINQFSEVVGISQEDDAEKSLQGVDVVIDFSNIESSLKHAALCASKNIKYVCGVTGFSQEQLKVFDECARKTPLFWSPNMSMGVAVVNALVKQASRMLDQDFVVKMKETHHTKKLDAPSGTAVMLRNSVNEFREQKVEIESIREGEVVGEHSVTFVSQLEKIKIKHEAFSRSVFADGALKCALWLSTRNVGKVYGMGDLLGLS
jgi:4-hydroxy-tetrahydrodipicolinate reductase